MACVDSRVKDTNPHSVSSQPLLASRVNAYVAEVPQTVFFGPGLYRRNHVNLDILKNVRRLTEALSLLTSQIVYKQDV